MSPEILHKLVRIAKILKCCLFLRQAVFVLEFCHGFYLTQNSCLLLTQWKMQLTYNRKQRE